MAVIVTVGAPRLGTPPPDVRTPDVSKVTRTVGTLLPMVNETFWVKTRWAAGIVKLAIAYVAPGVLMPATLVLNAAASAPQFVKKVTGAVSLLTYPLTLKVPSS